MYDILRQNFLNLFHMIYCSFKNKVSKIKFAKLHVDKNLNATSEKNSALTISVNFICPIWHRVFHFFVSKNETKNKK